MQTVVHKTSYGHCGLIVKGTCQTCQTTINQIHFSDLRRIEIKRTDKEISTTKFEVGKDGLPQVGQKNKSF